MSGRRFARYENPLIDIDSGKENNCVIGVAKVKDPSRYGVVVFDGSGKIKRLIEKPKQPVSDLALIGVYIFNDKIYDAIRKIKLSWRGELEITDAIQVLLESGAKIGFQLVQGWWKDTGRPEDLLEANQFVLQELQPLNEGVIEYGATVAGCTSIGKDTVVHGRTTIRGEGRLL